MIIASYNVNGLRAALRKGFLAWAASSKASVICIQESRVSPEQVDPSIFAEEGWHFQLYPSSRPGYSGTAILSREKPLSTTKGSRDALSDSEGRILSAEISGLTIVSMYAPSGSSGEIRQKVKMEWLSHLVEFTDSLIKSTPAGLLLAGDMNICHQPIDIHNPKSLGNTSGFLPEEREWMDRWLKSSSLTDTFRAKNPTEVCYSWWSQRGRAREKNLGWRIDYMLACPTMASRLKSAWIDTSARCSDHCPTFAEFE